MHLRCWIWYIWSFHASKLRCIPNVSLQGGNLSSNRTMIFNQNASEDLKNALLSLTIFFVISLKGSIFGIEKKNFVWRELIELSTLNSANRWFLFLHITPVCCLLLEDHWISQRFFIGWGPSGFEQKKQILWKGSVAKGCLQPRILNHQFKFV